jgi:pimaricinolide synthase PimS1
LYHYTEEDEDNDGGEAPEASTTAKFFIAGKGRAYDDASSSPPAAASRALDMDAIVAKVRACVESLAGRDVASDEPLMDAGLDSLTAVEARADLSEAFGVSLPATALFDYPTAAALASHISASLAPPAAAILPSAAADLDSALDLVCVPGGGSRSCLARITAWASAGGAGSSTGRGARERPAAIPHSRWDLEAARGFASKSSSFPAAHGIGILPAAFGAFLTLPEMFDPELFAVSAAEAVTMDVQQRLLLDATAAMAGVGAFD